MRLWPFMLKSTHRRVLDEIETAHHSELFMLRQHLRERETLLGQIMVENHRLKMLIGERSNNFTKVIKGG